MLRTQVYNSLKKVKTIKKWNIHEVGWEVFDSECSALTRGRSDVVIEATKPGTLYLVQTGRGAKAPLQAEKEALS